METWKIAIALVVAAIVFGLGGWLLFRSSSSCQYTVRVNKNNAWTCPDGWTDTGISWNAGPEKGKQQCKKC